MANELAVFRGRPGSRHPRAPNAPCAPQMGDVVTPHPLMILGLATSVRLDDPRREHERVVMLEVALVAGREAARALDRWLSQALTKYRGSRSSWDLEATTTELRMKLDQFEVILRDSAERLIALIPELLAETSGCVSPSAPESRRRRRLEEIAAVSRLFDAIQRGATSEGHVRDSAVTPVVTSEPMLDARDVPRTRESNSR